MQELISFSNLELHYQASAAGTPANPDNLNYSDRYFSYYGYYSFRFDIPVITENEVVLDTNCLYYRIFVDGDLIELTNEDYALGQYTSLIDVPFSFDNGGDIYAWGRNNREVGIYTDGVTTVGVQSVYKYDGLTTVSDVVTLNVRTGEISTTVGVDSVSDERNNVIKTEYFDINGMPITHPVKGIYIERQLLDNGEIKTVKKIER